MSLGGGNSKNADLADIRGYECAETRTVLTEETVTTTYDAEVGGNVSDLEYSNPIDADTIYVTFNGTEYVAQKQQGIGSNNYGATYDEQTGNPDWSEYPFIISYNSFGEINTIQTEDAGTYTVKIETSSYSANASECFTAAVNAIIGDSGDSGVFPLHITTVDPSNSNTLNASSTPSLRASSGPWLDKPFFLILEAFRKGFYVCVVENNLVTGENTQTPITEILVGSNNYTVVVGTENYTTSNDLGFPKKEG